MILYMIFSKNFRKLRKIMTSAVSVNVAGQCE